MNQNHPSSSHSSAPDALKLGVLCAGASIAAAAIANAVIAWNTPRAGARLGGGFYRVPLRYGDAAYFVSGRGTPVLLLHDLRPGSSSAEWEENFVALAQHHTVYALDFLGWGLSDKPGHFSRPADYVEQIRHFAEDVIGQKCAVVASGAAGQFALLAAQKTPHLFSQVALICPPPGEEATSGNEAEEDEEAEAFPEKRNLVYRALSLPIVGQSLTNWLTSRARLERKAQELFYDKTRITPGVISRWHVTAHQPGAQNALAAQAAGLLQSEWREAWSQLAVPALLVWGRLAPDLATAPEWLALHPQARLEVFEAALLPHVERPDEFNARLLHWLG